MRAVGGVELVERVEDEDDAPPARGFGEELLEMGDEFLDVERQGLGVARSIRKFVTEPTECATEVGGAGAGTDEVGEDENGRMGDLEWWRCGKRTAEFGEQRGFAGAGLAGEDEDVGRAAGVREDEQIRHQRLAAAEDVLIHALLDEGLHLIAFLGELVELCGAVSREVRGQLRVGFDALEYVGEDRLTECLRAKASEPSSSIVQNVFDAIDAFAGDAPQFDDITLMIVKRGPC